MTVTLYVPALLTEMLGVPAVVDHAKILPPVAVSMAVSPAHNVSEEEMICASGRSDITMMYCPSEAVQPVLHRLSLASRVKIWVPVGSVLVDTVRLLLEPFITTLLCFHR